MPNNPALKAIRAFEKDLGPLLDKVAALVQSGLDAGLTPERAVAAAFRRYKVERVLQAGIEAQMVSAIYIATGASAGLAVRRTLLDASFFPDKVKLSARIHDLRLRSVISDEIRGALRAGATFQRLAERLADGGITSGQLPKHLDALLSASRTFAPGDLQFQKAFAKSAGSIASLAQGGAPTKALKAGYLELLDKVTTARPEVLAKRVEIAVLEKARYNAERVARTEIARAWGYAQKDEIASDPDAVGVRWVLSSRHKIIDICDFHANADLYGMGPGVYPKDQSPPYPAHPNCILPGMRVYWQGKAVAYSKGFYRGPVVEIVTDLGQRLSVTGNHPIMTDRGWVAADEICKGSRVICRIGCEGKFPGVHPHDEQGNPTVEQVARAIDESGFVAPRVVPPSPEDFHGDGRFFNGHVNIVFSKGLLWSHFKPLRKRIVNSLLGAIHDRLFFFSNCAIFQFIKRPLCSADRIVRSLCHHLPKFWRRPGIGQPYAIDHAAPFDTSFYEPSLDHVSRHPERVREALLGLSGEVAFANVVSINHFAYSGHVFDLQVEPSEIYIANGVVVKNCLCLPSPVYIGEAPTGGKFDPGGGASYLADLDAQDKNALLTKSGAAAFDADPGKWRSELRNWQGHEKVVAGEFGPQ